MATLRATSDLQNNIFVDNTAGQISAQDMRDFVESVPNEKSTGKFEDDVKVKFGTTGGSHIRWSSTGTEMQVSSTGGAIRADAGNTDQFVLRTDGDVAMANSLKVGGTGSASGDGIEVTFSSGIGLVLNATGVDSDADIQFANDAQKYEVGVRTTDAFDIQDVTAGTLPFFLEAGAPNNTVRLMSDGNVEMRSGFLAVNGNSPSTALDVAGDITLQVGSTTSGTTLVVSSNDSTSQKIQRSSSTARVKSEIQPLTAEAISPDRVLEIDPVSYLRDGEPEVGFVAESFDWGPLSHGLAYDGEDRVFGFLAGSRVIDAAQQIVLRNHETRLSSTEAEIRELRSENQQLREQVRELKEAA